MRHLCCHQLAHRMKHPTKFAAQQQTMQANARAHGSKREQTEENGNKQQQPIAKRMQTTHAKDSTLQKSKKRNQIKAMCKKPQRAGAKLTKTQPSKANDNMPEQMIVNGVSSPDR